MVGVVVGRERSQRPDSKAAYEDPLVGYAIRMDAVHRVWAELPALRGFSAIHLATMTAPALIDDRLPLVREADLATFDVEPVNDVYITRSVVDAALDAALADAPFVLVLGGAAVGKSRSLAEALLRFASKRSVIVPKAGMVEIGAPVADRMPVAAEGGVL